MLQTLLFASAALASFPMARGFAIVGRAKANDAFTLLVSSGENNGDEVFFDDFDGQSVGGGDGDIVPEADASGAISHMLHRKIGQLEAEKHQKDIQTQQNWQSGQWRTRGFALGEVDEGILASSLALVSGDLVAVGRSHGGACVIQLGSDEFKATFSERPTLEQVDDLTVRPTTKLGRKEGEDQGAPGQFSIVADLPPGVSRHTSPITHMLFMPIEEGLVHLFSSSVSGSVQIHRLDLDTEEVRHVGTLEKDSPSPIVAMERVVENVLAVSSSGLAYVLDNAGKQLATWQIELDDDATIVTCASVDAEAGLAYFGTDSGSIVVHSVENGGAYLRSFQAHVNSGISAMTTAGAGALRGAGGSSRVLMTGGTSDGIVKRWEMLVRGDSVEYWPRLSTQKIPGAVHVLDHNDGYAVGSEGPPRIHAISVLPGTEDSAIKLVTAAGDVLRVWDPETGEVKHFMAGLDFEKDGSLASLLLTKELLISNGMSHCVCVHDFAILGDVDDSETGYDLEW